MNPPSNYLVSLADACPSCSPGDFPPVLPAGTPMFEAGSLHARYVHPVCGTVWSCWWDPAAVDWPLTRGVAA